MNLTPLEHSVLVAMQKEAAGWGFSHPDDIKVLSRSTSAGKLFVFLQAPPTLSDEPICRLGEDVHISTADVSTGLGFRIHFKERRPNVLEFHDFDQEWDGQQRAWILIDGGRILAREAGDA